MTDGLVQDYSKSPIKTTQAAPEVNTQALPQLDYAPPQQTTSHYGTYQASPVRPLADLSAPPPKKSMDISRPVGAPMPQPMGQQHDSPVLPIPAQPPVSTYTPSTSSNTIAGGYSQQPVNSYAAQTPYIQNDQGGYRQNPIHDGGATDYGNNEGGINMEYAEQAWKSATNAVSEYTSTAGEVAGKTLGSIKGWLNPESKGLR